MEASKLVHKILKFINYANLCKFIIKKLKKCFFSFISQPILIWFALSGRAKFGSLNFVPSVASNFLTSRKLFHMKFAIFDVARCRMSATSLTFLLFCLSPLIIDFFQDWPTHFQNRSAAADCNAHFALCAQKQKTKA